MYIEFLFVLIPLLLIFGATVAFGIDASVHQSVQNAAQVGAEVAASSGNASVGRSEALATLRAAGLTATPIISSTIDMSASCASVSGGTYQGEQAVVTVWYPSPTIFGFLDTPMFGDVGKVLIGNISATATAPVASERTAC